MMRERGLEENDAEEEVEVDGLSVWEEVFGCDDVVVWCNVYE